MLDLLIDLMKKSPINRNSSNIYQKIPTPNPKRATKVNQKLPMNSRKLNSKKNTAPLQTLENIIFELNEDNVQSSSQSAFVFFDNNFPYSFNYLISRLIYIAFVSQRNEIILYLNFLKHIEELEKNIQSYTIFYVFKSYLIKSKSQESCYLLSKMIEHELIQPDFIEEKKSLYFANYYTNEEIQRCKYKFYEQFFSNFEELSKNDWELHKKYVKEGVNPNEISKIIRIDEIEKLQEMSSQTNFDYNQIIKPSFYERYSFINKENVSLVDYAAFFGSVKCFKYLLLNGSNLENAGKYAIAGGNLEIIHLCEQNNSKFENSYEIAIEFHRNDIFRYLYENKNNKIIDLNNLGILCLKYSNFNTFIFLKSIGLKISGCIGIAAKIGNIYFLDRYLKNQQTFLSIFNSSYTSRNYEVVKYMLEKSTSDKKSKKEKYNTQFLKASYKGYFETVQWIVNQYKINIDQTSSDQYLTALMEASENDHIKIVKFLLEKNANINAKDIFGRTALIFASEKGNTEIVKLLLMQKGIDINAKDKEINKTALIRASEKGHKEIIKLLLMQKGIDVNAKDRLYRETALIKASENGHIEIVKLLLKQEGIDINAKDIYGRTALLFASEKGHTEIVKLLLEQKGIDINAKDKLHRETALIKASENGYIEIVKLLLKQKGIDINVKAEGRFTALMKASINGYTGIVKLLLEQEGIYINAKDNDGQTALILASAKGYTEIVKILLEQKGIDINAKDDWYGGTALIYASENGHIELVKLLLEHKGIINAKDKNGETTLMKASYNGHIEIVKLLIKQNGIDVNAKDKNGYTALMKASYNGHIEIVKLLLEHKEIDVNAKNKLGETVLIKTLKDEETTLMISLKYNYIKIIKILLSKQGINVNIKDDHGNTALMIASQVGNIKAVQKLLHHEDININEKNEDGDTALMYASSSGYLGIVKLLLEQQGINVKLKNKIGHTALTYATSRQHSKVVEVLQSFLNANQ